MLIQLIKKVTVIMSHKLFLTSKKNISIKFISLFFICLFNAFFAWGKWASAQAERVSSEKPITIGVSAIVDHPSLTYIKNGIKDFLEESHYIDGKNMSFLYQTAQNRQATMVQIARKYIGDHVDILVPIGTAASQAMVNNTKTIPIIFSGVTNGVSAGLLTDNNHPDKNVTGVSDLPDLDKHFALIKTLLPHIKNLGFIYNPSEANSLFMLKKLKETARQHGVNIVESTVIQTVQVRNAALALVGRIDALYIGNDNTVISALETALNVTRAHKIPVITADAESVTRGALAAYSPSYYEVGRETGRLVLEVLKGVPIKDLPVRFARKYNLILNEQVAKTIGFTFPADLLARATTVIK